ncbi:D-alanyl-D-alanine endopeptidase [Pseudomonas matsuisoli]|uniref:D-alanyl-D-alanine endopeptidase n=1 Tax=Pseudomonas matsuisoli TaxID=1515666 RepID=A0A917PWL2_9PSED|nr:D-alanyl-D-alanine endopeptidase [Pseudomonas matsuisoli]GGJ95115.1 D-alanyl-D-alanine endopeptidase [Pseudomonas matsuisoli]
MNLRRPLAGLALACLAFVSPVQAKEITVNPQQELASGSALLVDMNTNKVLYSSNPDVQVPIASVTKLMTAVVLLDAKQSMSEKIPVVIKHNPDMQGVYSRVRLGSEVSRHDMLLMTLMSSENRAATSLAENYPGGMKAFVAAMNAKAKALGMTRTRYVEPTGLSEKNVSTANDLVKLLKATKQYPMIEELSATPSKAIAFGKPAYSLQFNNTNRLTRNSGWDIELTKTGFTNAAGHCLVMRTRMAGKPVAFVVLDSYGKLTHIADATRLRKWLETGKVSQVPAAALSYKQQRLAARQGGTMQAQATR